MKNSIINAKDIDELKQLRDRPFNHLNDFETTKILLRGKPFEIRNGFTLTPFANAKPCNAHCQFCSEELIPKGKNKPSSKELIIDFDKYFSGLNQLLLDLSNSQINISLSGLEATNEYQWLELFLNLISKYPNIGEKVLYTNGSGLTDLETLDLIRSNSFDKIELSRIHDDEKINQEIMYFNKNVSVRNNNTFSTLISRLSEMNNLKISCILNEQGVKNINDVKRYLSWLQQFGVKEVVFRELSIIENGYIENKTLRWINKNRVEILNLLKDLAIESDFEYLYSTGGYYYYNETYNYKSSMKVIFETSSYEFLKKQNQSEIIHKLIYHSNGNVTTDWDSETSILANYYD